MPRAALARRVVAPARRGVVAFASDEALVAGVRARNPAALGAFHDLLSDHVLRVLGRLLGADRDLADAHHDVFVRALASLDGLRDPASLKAWITAIAVFTARTLIQRRSRRRWLSFFAPEDVPDVAIEGDDGEAQEALRATYAALDRLPTDERIAFALQRIEGMDLREIADACGVSLATVKRRLARGEERFEAAVRQDPTLAAWLNGGAS